MAKIMHIFKKLLFIIIIATTFLFSKESKGQCNDSIYTNSTCITPNNNITFQTNNTLGAWWIYDATGNLMFSHIPGSWGSPPLPTNIINYTFPLEGIYSVEFSDGGWPSCNYTLDITVVSNPVNLSLSTNSTQVCTNGSIDYSSLGINITNATGNVSYYWELPNGQNWTGLTPFPIPTGQNNVTLTITDDATGCSDSETISLTYQSTNADASFVSSVNTITCPGQSVTFTANNINTSLYSYSWEIDGAPINGGTNGVLNTNVYPNGNNVSVTLFVEDLSNGCIVQQSQILNINTPNYVALDTTVSNYDQQMNAFVYCENDSTILDTLFNIFSNTSGIDTVIIYNGFTQEIYTSSQGFNNFFINISESVYNIYVTTIFQGNCPPVTTSYDILYNQTAGGLNVNFGTCSQSNGSSRLCIGDTVNYFIDPQQFQMSLNAVVHFVIKCNDTNIDTITWNYNDFQQNTYFTDADCNALTPDVQKIVFPYLFEESSCGCYFYDDALGNIYDKYRIIPIIETHCDTIPMTLGLLEYVPPNPTATFFSA